MVTIPLGNNGQWTLNHAFVFNEKAFIVCYKIHPSSKLKVKHFQTEIRNWFAYISVHAEQHKVHCFLYTHRERDSKMRTFIFVLFILIGILFRLIGIISYFFLYLINSCCWIGKGLLNRTVNRCRCTITNITSHDIWFAWLRMSVSINLNLKFPHRMSAATGC